MWIVHSGSLIPRRRCRSKPRTPVRRIASIRGVTAGPSRVHRAFAVRPASVVRLRRTACSNRKQDEAPHRVCPRHAFINRQNLASIVCLYCSAMTTRHSAAMDARNTPCHCDTLNFFQAMSRNSTSFQEASVICQTVVRLACDGR